MPSPRMGMRFWGCHLSIDGLGLTVGGGFWTQTDTVMSFSTCNADGNVKEWEAANQTIGFKSY